MEFGKEVFRVKRGLGNSLTTVSNIIVVCAILHNIGLQINDKAPENADFEFPWTDQFQTYTCTT